MDTDEVGEACTLVGADVTAGVVKIVTTTPPDVVSNCVGGRVVATTSVDACCVVVAGGVVPVTDADVDEAPAL